MASGQPELYSKRYKILSSEDLDDLENQVNTYLENGNFSLFGIPFATNGLICQVVVNYRKLPDGN